MPEKKFKVGDVAKVKTAKGGHEAEGKRCKVQGYSGDKVSCVTEDNRQAFDAAESDLQPVD